MSTLLSERSQLVVDAEEAAIRRDLAACYRLVALYGWDDMTATHISARLPGKEEYLINPYGMFFDEITASSLVKINADGEILQPTPYEINPAGFVIHSAIHMARETDAGCVIHLHTRDGMAVSAIEDGLLPLTQTAMVILGDIAFHEYEGVAVNMEERVRLQQDLGEKYLMILRNHGTLAIGRTVKEAFRRITLLEQACSAQVAALSMGRPLHLPHPAVAEMTDRRYSPKLMEASAARCWPPLLRKLDRENPGYAN